MARHPMTEIRRLTIPAPLVLDATLAFDREQNGWLWLASDHEIALHPQAPGRAVIAALRKGTTSREVTERSAAWIAAAIIHYCFRRRIPIPRHSSKRIEIASDSVALYIESTSMLLPIEASSRPRSAAATAQGHANPATRDPA